MSTLSNKIAAKPWIGWLLFFMTVVIVFLLGLLTSTIMERRAETLFLDAKQIEIQPFEPRNEVWGVNYPRQYESYMNTADTSFVSKHMGGSLIDALDRYPALVILWAGYAFSKDYNQGRGHYYAVTDVYNSLRTAAPMTPEEGPMPGTCWTCKSTDVPRMMNEIGVKEFYGSKWAGLGHEIVNAIGCADCHDEKTMDLRITRPALIEAFERQGKDITKSTHQEMRSLVCAQCHVEYYFNTKKPHEGVPYLTFPWDDGMSAEAMEEYFDRIEFTDWVHSVSRAPMLKAQHPDYEVYMTGVHAARGVSCADCHMPYKSQGGVKFTDHHLQSPLNNVANSCQVCHRESEQELIRSVNERHDRVISNRYALEQLLVKTHLEAKFAWDKGATEAQMKDILKDIRHAQWRWDYVAASHGGSFHSPVESLRVIGTGIEKAQEARLKISRLLATLGHSGEVPLPDLSTKAKAQAYIGLDIPQLKSEKQEFLDKIVPQWLEKANERQSEWPQHEQSKKVKFTVSR